jgi:hypothetical protein
VEAINTAHISNWSNYSSRYNVIAEITAHEISHPIINTKANVDQAHPEVPNHAYDGPEDPYRPCLMCYRIGKEEPNMGDGLAEFCWVAPNHLHLIRTGPDPLFNANE